MTFAGFIKGQNRKQKPMMGGKQDRARQSTSCFSFFNTT